MNKKAIIVLILLLIIVGGLIGVNVYQGKVADKVKEGLAGLSGKWKGGADTVEYSFWGSKLTLKNFSISYDMEDGLYAIKAATAVVEGLDIDVLKSLEPGVLAKRLTLSQVEMSFPGGKSSLAEEEMLVGVKGPFGQIMRLMNDNADRQTMLMEIYKIEAAELYARNAIVRDPEREFGERQLSNDFTIKELSGKNVSALKVDNISMKQMEFVDDGRVVGGIVSAEARYDLSSLAPYYTPGREMMLYRQLLNPKQVASLYFAIDKMRMEARSDSPAADLEKFFVDYQSSEKELSLNASMTHLKFDLAGMPGENMENTKRIMDGRELDLSLAVDSKINDEDFRQTKIDFILADLFKLSLEAELMGRMPMTTTVRRISGSASDSGLLDMMLKFRAGNQNQSVDEARADLVGIINKNLSNTSNPFLADLGKVLAQSVEDGGGSLQVSITPERPLNFQQLTLYFLFQPGALNYSIETK